MNQLYPLLNYSLSTWNKNWQQLNSYKTTISQYLRNEPFLDMSVEEIWKERNQDLRKTQKFI